MYEQLGQERVLKNVESPEANLDLYHDSSKNKEDLQPKWPDIADGNQVHDIENHMASVA